MLGKSHRLSRSQFDHFSKTGRRFHSPTLTLIYSPHDRFHGSVVVGKKVAKSAVRRNKLRRRLYELLRQHSKKAEITPGVFIVITKPSLNSLTKEQTKTALTKLLEKTGKGA